MGCLKPDDAQYCAIQGCTRWSRKFQSEFMCGDHWRRLSRAERAVLRRIWRFMRKVGYPWGQPLTRREMRIWRAAKKRAA